MTTETITLNNRNTTGTWTADMDCYEVARTLTPRQRHIFFQVGAEIGNIIAVRIGFQLDVHHVQNYALKVCEMTEWKSIKAALVAFEDARRHGYVVA